MADFITPLDIAGSYGRGRLVYEAGQEANRRNALEGFLRQNGGALMQGDQNALAAYAGFDPAAAFQMQAGQQRLDLDRRQTEQSITASKAGMANDAARLGILRQEAAQRAAEHAATMSAAERAETVERINTSLAQATAAKTPEDWDRIMSSNPDAKGYVGQFEHRNEIFAGVLGVKDAMEMAQEKPLRARPGDVFLDPNTMQQVGAVPEQAGGGFRPATPEELQRYGAPAGQVGPDGRFYPINPPGGMTVFGPDGKPIIQTGGARGSALTEGQSKNVIYATRAEGALGTLDQFSTSLTSLGDAALQAVPGGLGRYAQSPEFQQARQAGDEFLQAILRKDTGAAITSQEMDEYGRTYLPMPGDSPQVLEQKQASRARAVEALRRGMTPNEILALERPVGGQSAIPQSAVDAGIDPDLWQYMSPEDQALWQN